MYILSAIDSDLMGDVTAGHRAGDWRTWCRMRWWSRKTLCNTQGSETCRCIYMQVQWWLQACQSLSDKVQMLLVFLLSLYSSLLVCVPVFPTHSQGTHGGSVMSQFHWLVPLCLIFSGEWRSETWGKEIKGRRERKRASMSGMVKFMENIWGKGDRLVFLWLSKDLVVL